MSGSVPGATPGEPDWAQAARQAEQLVDAAAGEGAEQRAGREPRPVAGVQSEEEIWHDSALCRGLRHLYPEERFKDEILATYVFQPDTDLSYIKETWLSG